MSCWKSTDNDIKCCKNISGLCPLGSSTGGSSGGSTGTSETVSIFDNSSMPAIITNTDLRGSYLLKVVSVENDGATGIFSVSSRSASIAGSVSKLSSSRGAKGESVRVQWLSSTKVQIYHKITRTVGPSGILLAYTVTIL